MDGEYPFPKTRQFGPFSLDPQSGVLTRNGLRLRLQPQPARILVLLTDAPGRLVTREEMRMRIWGADTVADTEQSLNFAIRQIRAVLHDDADRPEYLETIAKRGYRFIAPVSEIASEIVAEEKIGPAQHDRKTGIEHSLPPKVEDTADGRSAEAASVLAGKTDSRTTFVGHGKFRAGLLVLAIFAVTCLVATLAFHRYQKRGSGPLADSIAVLPFVNLTGDPSLEYIADGMTEETITRLATLEPSRLLVIARTSAMSYKYSRKTAQQIGRELNVLYVVEGSLRRQNNQLRVIAKLIRVSDQMHLWAKSYQGEDVQLPEFEDQVAESVANALSLHRLNRAEEHVPASDEAYNDYLQGMFFLSQ